MLTQQLLSDIAQIKAVNANRTTGWVIEAGNQVKERTLACPAGANESENFPARIFNETSCSTGAAAS